MIGEEIKSVQVTLYQRKILMALQRGAVVFRPARRPPGEHHLIGQIKIEEPGKPRSRIQDRVADQLVAMGLVEVTSRRAPGGFRLDYQIPSGIKLVDVSGSPV